VSLEAFRVLAVSGGPYYKVYICGDASTNPEEKWMQKDHK
jgi:hypothetical protein